MVVELRVDNPTLPAEGHAVRVTAGGQPIAVFRVGGQLFALDARCPHVGGPLDRGPVAGTQVTCPLHGSIFDVRDGHLVRGPASHGVTAYRTRLDGTTLVLERD